MKKVLINFSYLLLLLTFLSTPVLADRDHSDFTSGNFYCSYEKSGVEIEFYLGQESNLVIPDQINNSPVI